MLTLPNKNLSGTIRNGEKDSLRYSKINQKAASGKQIAVVRMAAADSRTPSLCQLRHAARWDPEDSAQGQGQAGRDAEPDGSSHHLSPPHTMLICKHSGKPLSLFRVDVGLVPSVYVLASVSASSFFWSNMYWGSKVYRECFSQVCHGT